MFFVIMMSLCVQFGATEEVKRPYDNQCRWTDTPDYVEIAGVVYLKGDLVCNGKRYSKGEIICPESEADNLPACGGDTNPLIRNALEVLVKDGSRVQSQYNWQSPPKVFKCKAAGGKEYCAGYALCGFVRGRFTACDKAEADGCDDVFKCAFLRTNVSEAKACATEYAKEHPKILSAPHDNGVLIYPSNP